VEEERKHPYKRGGRWGRSVAHSLRLTPEDSDLLERVSSTLRRSKTSILEDGLHMLAQKHGVPLRRTEGYVAPE
jgi:hypothetical protein